MQKPLWFGINRKDFKELTREIYNKQENHDFRIIINKKAYDLKNANKFWTEVTTRKITESETKKLYNELIQKDINALKKEKSDDIRKYNVLNILNNVGSIFTGTYLHYRDIPKETMFERSIAERIKLTKERFNEIDRKNRI